MTVRELINDALKQLRIDGRTKAGKAMKRQREQDLVRLNRMLDYWAGVRPSKP